jgi:hypothetical protein
VAGFTRPLTADLTTEQRAAFDQMVRGAAAEEADISRVVDPDEPSRFGQIFRVVLFRMRPPQDVNEAAWDDVQRLFFDRCVAAVVK